MFDDFVNCQQVINYNKAQKMAMKKKQTQQQQLQISSFIKEPASLKLLILAGTNIKHTELSIVTKCTGLIKLDLSGNFLSQLPIKFNNFTQMKILYLHDNQLNQVDIKSAHLEYISLFKNPIQSSQYRRELIQMNPELLGIDFNVVTSKEKFKQQNAILPVYSQIKWPIVEISANLEQEDDYLNLLKAEIFVISNVYKRTQKIESIQKVIQGVVQATRYKYKKSSTHIGLQFLPSVLKAVKKWKKYTALKKKLRAILSKKQKQHLLDTYLQINKNKRSKDVDDVMDAFLPQVRAKLKVRAVIERQSRAFRAFLPAKKQLETNYLDYTQNRDYNKYPAKLYFRYSQTDILSKVCLYAKKLFFKQKDYDLCDEFNNLFKQTDRKYYIFRKNQYLDNQWANLVNIIHETRGYVLSQVGVDRKYLLYNKKGLKSIKLKRTKKLNKIDNLQQKMQSTTKKIDYLYEKYDKLIQYQVHNWKILKTMLKIIRYINAGNSSSIISTETAYFQTEVIFDNDQPQPNKRVRIHMGLEFFTKRVIAANIIQRSWRKFNTKRKNINVVETIKKQRAQGLVSKWLGNLIFSHRMSNLQTRSYYESAWKQKQVYFHLDIYINMPQPTNLLRFVKKLDNKNEFYNYFNSKTQVQIVQTNLRRWVKIQFNSAKEAVRVQNLLQKYTYRYANSFCLKLFTSSQINDTRMLTLYEKQVKDLFNINIVLLPKSQQQPNIKTTVWIDNPQPYFVWSQINATQHFSKFQQQQRNSTNVSIFIYNKHKRPLKVSCELYWVHQQSLYKNKKMRQVYSKKDSDHKSMTVALRNSSPKPNSQNYLQDAKNGDDRDQFSMLDLQMGLKSNMRKGKAKYAIDFNRKLDRSQNKIDSRRNFLGSSHNSSLNKSHRTRVISDHRLEHLAETLNIRGK